MFHKITPNTLLKCLWQAVLLSLDAVLQQTMADIYIAPFTSRSQNT